MYTTQEPALVGALGLLGRAIDYTRGCLQFVTPADLARPTPCREWELHSLLAHMDDSLAALVEAGEQGGVTLRPAPADGAGVELVARLQQRACALLGAWTHNDGADLIRVAGSPISAAALTGAGALEVAVHGWDVAAACRIRHPLPARLAEELLELVPFLVSDRDRPARFADPLDVPAAVPAGTRLLAALGRAVPAVPCVPIPWRSR